jgi:hypothetical protein
VTSTNIQSIAQNKADELERKFFTDLKNFNSTNYVTILNASFEDNTPTNESKIKKCFSSVITRYFIFREKHVDEISEKDMNMLYYQLKIDLIAKYFSEYPESDISPLKAFQEELQKFASNHATKKDKDKADEKVSL